MKAFTFTIEGKPCSTNQITRRVGNKSITSREAREYKARVTELATYWIKACRCSFFETPVKVVLRLFGVRIDIDNCAKVILDGMQGPVYANDNLVEELLIVRFPKDQYGQRIEVLVEERGDYDLPVPLGEDGRRVQEVQGIVARALPAEESR